MKQSRVVIPAGQTKVLMPDYFNTVMTIQITIIGGSSVAVTGTAEDPNDPSYTATYVALPAPLNAAIVANGIFPISLAQYRGLKFVVTGGTSAAVTILQGSGDGMVG
jgi:hypothetical protein